MLKIKAGLITVLAPTILLAAMGLQQGRAQTPDANAEITAFEAAFSSALARNDVGELKGYLADDWKIISGDGNVIDKNRFLKVIAGGDLKHTQMTTDNLTIRRYDNFALVTSHAKSAGSYKGAEFSTDEIGTDMLIKRRGRWTCVMTQLTTLAKH
jgi:Domain of unknown function (DUF4440)